MRLCSIEEVRVAEDAAVAAGTPERELMRRAGESLAGEILKDIPGTNRHAVFLIGPGNNGGDGLVAAATLRRHGWQCSAWTFNRRDPGDVPAEDADLDSIIGIDSLEALGAALDRADICVDAVFGIGGRDHLPGPVRDAFAVALAARRKLGLPLWAVDTPSGVNGDSGAAADGAFAADVTVMLGLPKTGLYRAPGVNFTGQLRLIDIGLALPASEPDSVGLLTLEQIRALMPRRNAQSHKSSVGWLLVIGGAPNYVGAPRLAAEAAMRTGAGLVGLAVPDILTGPIATSLPEAVFLPLTVGSPEAAGPDNARIIREALPRYRAAVIGPGLGQDQAVDDMLSQLFDFHHEQLRTEQPATPGWRAVIDADGLNWLATQPDWEADLRASELILTPHPGELARLLQVDAGQIVADPWHAAREAASRFGQVLVLKQAHPVIAAPDGRLVMGPQANPALASAGTGDVLAGIIGGLLAQGLTAWDAARAGVFVGSLAGEFAAKRVGTLSLIARDVINALPEAMRLVYDTRW